MADADSSTAGGRTLEEKAYWANVVNWYRSRPDEASVLLEDQGGNRFENPTMLNHVLANEDPPPEAVSAIVAAFPEAVARKVGPRGETALATAIRRQFPTPMIHALVDAYFSTWRGSYKSVRDIEGVLNFMLGHSEHLDAEMARDMLKKMPLAMMTDSSAPIMIRWLLFAYFCPGCVRKKEEWTESKRSRTWGVAQVLLEFVSFRTTESSDGLPRCMLKAFFDNLDDIFMDAEAISNLFDEMNLRDKIQFSREDESGRLPLHLLLATESLFVFPWAERVVGIVVRGFPGATRVLDPLTLELPLHMIARSSLPPSVVRKAGPDEAIRTRSIKEHLYPYQVALLHGARKERKYRCQPLKYLNAAYFLLRQDPTVLQELINSTANRCQGQRQQIRSPPSSPKKKKKKCEA